MFSLWIHYLDADVVVPVKCKQMAGSFVVLFTTGFHHVSSHRVIGCSLIVPCTTVLYSLREVSTKLRHLFWTEGVIVRGNGE